MTSMFDADGWPARGEKGPKVVALGGGHGLSATLRALRHITRNLTAVVTVADDGGSSGRIRSEMDVLPPGDLRMALASLCDDSEWGLTWRDVIQHRFETGGHLDQHALGNLLIVSVWELLGDTVAGLDLVARLLDAHGRVLPMASVPLEIEADVEYQGEVSLVRGQSTVASTPGKVLHIRLVPAEPNVSPEVIEAVSEAEWVVLGPGSWFTSVLPHLLVPKLRDAITRTKARRALVMNLTTQHGETDGMSPTDHLQVLLDHVPELRFDVVLADPANIPDIDGFSEACAQAGAHLLLRQVRTGSNFDRHDPLRLGAALRDAFEGFLGEVGKPVGQIKTVG